MLVHVLADSARKISRIRSALEKDHQVSAALLGDAAPAIVDVTSVVVDADLRDSRVIDHVRLALRKVRGADQCLFVVDEKDRPVVVQALALGASGTVPAPLDARRLRRELAMRFPAAPQSAGSDEAAGPAAVSIGAATLASMFQAVQCGKPVNLVDAEAATSMVVNTVAASGLTDWLDNVRRYHEGTFQHCLLVTGITVDFALHLGFSSRDVKRLGVAATLHDIGKAKIPLAILDNPGKLNAAETAIMRTHAALGYDALDGVAGVSADVLDAVRHHHEYLDGSGYPDGLKGREISDPVRVLTISDIFAALIEARVYRRPMPRAKAYAILNEMAGTKLEKALVDAFRGVALTR